MRFCQKCGTRSSVALRCLACALPRAPVSATGWRLCEKRDC